MMDANELEAMLSSMIVNEVLGQYDRGFNAAIRHVIDVVDANSLAIDPARAELARLRADNARLTAHAAELEQAIDRALEQIENGDIKIAHGILQELIAPPSPDASAQTSECEDVMT